ncbi:hypothetical protein LVJ83_01255 [Uruburuella testudinis]|uniref:Uncharacterized protein n=1 Tax=Uruburuella testudinis TaxID=1282863 RepID=A0ABY4DTF2_9NEIS|nr:hypothetical protein [Uruburuella testudinis]UOO82136.1 hypothetical protein LVJ83_01255 [Uruburuella testudinis]
MNLIKIAVVSFILYVPLSARADIYFGSMGGLMQICTGEYLKTGKTAKEWLLLQAQEIAKNNPAYPQGTVFRLIIVPAEGGDCDSKLDEHLMLLREAVAENRRNLGNADYLPYDIAEYMDSIRYKNRLITIFHPFHPMKLKNR